MAQVDEYKDRFGKQLETLSNRQAARLDTDIDEMRKRMMLDIRSAMPADIGKSLLHAENSLSQRLDQAAVPQVNKLLNLAGHSDLKELDWAFSSCFNPGKYFPVDRLKYPTIFCETLEEFFDPILKQVKLSPEARQVELKRMVEDALKTAKDSNGGGIFGVNLPGQGCYLNGWLFAYGEHIHPNAVFQNPEVLARVIGTAVHEKLGHGFIEAYSAIGAVKTSLGLAQINISNRFGLLRVEDPLASLRREQANLLFMVSQLMEEGWATWVESYLGVRFMKVGRHPYHDLKRLVEAVNNVPEDLKDRKELVSTFLGALAILFGEENYPLGIIHQAVMAVELLGNTLDPMLETVISQPIRYAVGELLATQAEGNLGAQCVPYATLIAGGVSFDPGQISLSDLGALFSRDPQLHPDARFAALSRLQLTNKNDVAELAQKAAADYSFAVPQEFKAGQ